MYRLLHSRWTWVAAFVMTAICVGVAALIEPYRRHCLLQELDRAGINHFVDAVEASHYANIMAVSRLPTAVFRALPKESQTWFVSVEQIVLDPPKRKLTPLHVRAL